MRDFQSLLQVELVGIQTENQTKHYEKNPRTDIGKTLSIFQPNLQHRLIIHYIYTLFASIAEAFQIKETRQPIQ